MVFVWTQAEQDLADLAVRFGLTKINNNRNEWYRNVAIGTELRARINAVGGALTLDELEQKEKPKTVPESATIGFDNITENSVLVFWNPHSDGGSPITGFHVVIKNEDTGQTITESTTSFNVTNMLLQNLDSGTNYKVYIIVINAIGNSFEQSNGFKTLGTIPTPTPIIIPDGFHQMPDGSIMADSDMYNFIIESDGLVRMFRIGAVEYTEIKVFPDSVQSFIDRGVSRLLTASERAIPYPRPVVEPPVIEPPVIEPPVIEPPVVEPPVVEKTWCIDIYQINEFGGVYSTHKEDVKRLELIEWEKSTLVKECGDPIPSDQEVQDFYNFVDTSIDTNMVSQSVGYFKLQNGKVTGNIIYIAESAFNPYYYNKPVTSVVQIKNRAGNIIKLKTNNLNFTETQRDETININEGVGDIEAVKIEYYVWKGINEPVSFAVPQKPNEIVDTEIFPDPCPIGQHRDFNNNCVDDDQKEGTTSLLGKFMGVTALIGTLALLGSKGK